VVRRKKGEAENYEAAIKTLTLMIKLDLKLQRADTANGKESQSGETGESDRYGKN